MKFDDDGETVSELPVFEMADGIKEARKFCTAFGIVPKQTEYVPQLLNAGMDNGTLTFIEHGNDYFAVTCKHVVEVMRFRNKKYGEGSYVLATLKDGTYLLGDEFHIPSSPAGSHVDLDIAIAHIPRDFPAQIGKRFLKLAAANDERPIPLKYAIAVGFPTGDKTETYGPDGYRVVMPCVQATAEAMVSERQFLSILSDAPATGDLSGMSGGPVFWSTADDFGLVGFVYEGDQTGVANDMIQHPRIRFFVETCDYHEFSRWTEELRAARTGRVVPVRRIA